MSVPDLRCVASVSGFRGIIGESMDPAVAMSLATAFGSCIAQGAPVVVGRDSRPTGDCLLQAVSAGLRGVGCTVIDIGIVPTPTVPIMVRELGAGGGIQLSASHNPVEWNALKCFNAGGRNIDGHQFQALLDTYQAGPQWVDWSRQGRMRSRDDALDIHLERVLAAVDVAAIRSAGLSVLLDSVNGAGSTIGPRLLDSLGCRTLPLYANSDRIFPRDPEPTAEKVQETGRVVVALGADIGFVQDPDADRLAIIDETGRYIGEEYTLVLCAAARLAAAKAAGIDEPIACTNLSTSRMLEDVAATIGGRVVRSAVGEANVVDAMQRSDAVIGGEGNGGVIDPRVVIGRDSQIGIALVLEALARSGKRLSELIAEIPSYGMHKTKIPVGKAELQEQFAALRGAAFAADAHVDETDGLKFSWLDRWVHVRASGTEPASRIIAEAPTLAEAQTLAADVREVLRGAGVALGE